MAAKVRLYMKILEKLLLWKHGMDKDYIKLKFVLVRTQYITCLCFI